MKVFRFFYVLKRDGSLQCQVCDSYYRAFLFRKDALKCKNVCQVGNIEEVDLEDEQCD